MKENERKPRKLSKDRVKKAMPTVEKPKIIKEKINWTLKNSNQWSIALNSESMEEAWIAKWRKR